MAEFATIARPYAEALFQSHRDDLAGAATWVDQLAAVAGDPALKAFADNPKVARSQVFEVITSVLRSPLPATGQNLLRTVIDNGRLGAMPEIAAQFRALTNAKIGSSDATVYSAFPIEGAALADTQAVLEKRFGRKLNLRVEQDVDLIGGIRVVVGDEVLDTSVKARLDNMKAVLTA